MAPADAAPAFHHDPATCVVNAINCACAMVRFERGQRTVAKAGEAYPE